MTKVIVPFERFKDLNQIVLTFTWCDINGASRDMMKDEKISDDFIAMVYEFMCEEDAILFKLTFGL